MRKERTLVRLAAASLVTTIVGANAISVSASDFTGHEHVFADLDLGDTESTEVPVEGISQDGEENGVVSIDSISADNAGTPADGTDTPADDEDASTDDEGASADNDGASTDDGGAIIVDDIIEVPVEDTTIDNMESESDWVIMYHETSAKDSSMIYGTPQYINDTEIKEDIPVTTTSKNSYNNTDVVVAYSDSDDSEVEAETVVEDDFTLSFKEELADTDTTITTPAKTEPDVLLATDSSISKSHRIPWMIPAGFAAAVLAVGSVMVLYRKKIRN